MSFFADNACAWGTKLTIDNRVGQLSPVLYPQRAIESPVLDRFAYMFGGNLIVRLQIGDRARHLSSR